MRSFLEWSFSLSEPMPDHRAFDPALEALVRLAAAVAAGVEVDLEPFLVAADAEAAPQEVEEVLLQSYLFLGYPAALNALAAWRRVSGQGAPPRDEGAWSDWALRGPEVCQAVYGSAYPDLRTNISAFSPDMDEWMVVEGYGKVLGRPGLALWRRECCIAAMLAVLGTVPQLRSHLRGALRTGTPPAVVEAVVDAALDLTPPSRQDDARGGWALVLQRWEQQ